MHKYQTIPQTVVQNILCKLLTCCNDYSVDVFLCKSSDISTETACDKSHHIVIIM